jgi:hypothetical protein
LFSEKLFLVFFRGDRSRFSLFFYEQGSVLLTKAKGTASRQKLRIGGWFATRIAAPNVGFYGFHQNSPGSL